MTSIFNSNNISIEKKGSSYILEFSQMQNKDFFIDSLNLNKIIKKDSEKRCYKSGSCKIKFKMENVFTLSKFLKKNKYLNYNDLVYMFLSLKKQIEFLKKRNYGILFFNVNDIVVFDNGVSLYFLFLNPNNVFEINDNILNVTRSFEKKNPNNFLSPELLTLNAIPFNVDYRCSLFSLSLLVAYCISGDKLDFLKPISWNADDFKSIVEPINNTKLYWALLRCQEVNPNNRFLLWI